VAGTDHGLEIDGHPPVTVQAVGVQFMRVLVQTGNRAQVDHGRRIGVGELSG
jgi:hypothetical protein